MDEQHASTPHHSGHLADKVKSSLAVLWSPRRVKLLTRPEDRSFGRRIKPLGIEDGAAVVIAKDREAKFHHFIQALAGMGTVPNHISETNDLADRLRPNVFKHGFNRG